MATLNTELFLSIVTGDEDLSLLGHHDSAILATADLLHDQLFAVDASDHGCCRLESRGGVTQTCRAVLTRPPQIDVATIRH